MGYNNLEAALLDLEKNNQLIRIKELVDPNLEMAAIHLQVYEAGGPALLFENVKGSKFRAASNIFGTLDRSKFLFRDTLQRVQQLIAIKNNPVSALKNPIKSIGAAWLGTKALPLKNPLSKKVKYQEIKISDIPLIKHWDKDGGAFVTLPQVYSENILKPGIMNSNLGMYRIQLTGNDYILDKEIGLHYQLHRGIGVHQTIANNNNEALKVSCFVGGPPSHSVSAVMPLPEGLSEMTFAGALGNRRFRYTYDDGYCLSTDADFVITGYVNPKENKIEGPFGDHLGYYSLQHEFPLMHVHKVYAKKDAIWAFTVVGRPPQEDTSFGQLIHEITGDAIMHELPGVQEVHAVDASGVHPLLLAVGSERYTPYNPTKQPAELLTIANHILGKGQLSLAKYLWITSPENKQKISAQNIPEFFDFMLRRIDWKRDIHFHTKTTMDTLDYSGSGLNEGSKVVFAAYGNELRNLGKEIPEILKNINLIKNVQLVASGIIAFTTQNFKDYETTVSEIENLNEALKNDIHSLSEIPLMILCDDANFVAEKLNNFLWVSFTRSNPAKDIYGIDSFTHHKHWGCNGPLIIDARVKPFHAPAVEVLNETKKAIVPIFDKGGSLYGKL